MMMRKEDFRAIVRAVPTIASVVNDPLFKTPQGAQIVRDLQTLVGGIGLSFTCIMPAFKVLGGIEREGWTEQVQQLVDWITEPDALFGGYYDHTGKWIPTPGDADYDKWESGEMVEKMSGLSYDEFERHRAKRIEAENKGEEPLIRDKETNQAKLLRVLQDEQFKADLAKQAALAVAGYGVTRALHYAFGPGGGDPGGDKGQGGGGAGGGGGGFIPVNATQQAEVAQLKTELRQQQAKMEEQQKVLNALQQLQQTRQETAEPAVASWSWPWSRPPQLADMTKEQRVQWFQDKYTEYVQKHSHLVKFSDDMPHHGVYTRTGSNIICTPGRDFAMMDRLPQGGGVQLSEVNDLDTLSSKLTPKEKVTFDQFLKGSGVSDYRDYNPDDGTPMGKNALDYATATFNDYGFNVQETSKAGTRHSFWWDKSLLPRPGVAPPGTAVVKPTSQIFNMSSLFGLWMAILFVLLFWRTWKRAPSGRSPSRRVEKLIFKEKTSIPRRPVVNAEQKAAANPQKRAELRREQSYGMPPSYTSYQAPVRRTTGPKVFKAP